MFLSLRSCQINFNGHDQIPLKNIFYDVVIMIFFKYPTPGTALETKKQKYFFTLNSGFL